MIAHIELASCRRWCVNRLAAPLPLLLAAATKCLSFRLLAAGCQSGEGVPPPSMRRTWTLAGIAVPAARGGSATAHHLRLPPPPWRPILHPSQLQRGLAFYGSGGRIERVAAKLLAGRPIKAFTTGGSVTNGGGASSDATAYPARFFKFLNATFPHSGHVLANKAIGGATSAILSLCAEALIPPVRTGLCGAAACTRQRQRACRPPPCPPACLPACLRHTPHRMPTSWWQSLLSMRLATCPSPRPSAAPLSSCCAGWRVCRGDPPCWCFTTMLGGSARGMAQARASTTDLRSSSSARWHRWGGAALRGPGKGRGGGFGRSAACRCRASPLLAHA